MMMYSWMLECSLLMPGIHSCLSGSTVTDSFSLVDLPVLCLSFFLRLLLFCYHSWAWICLGSVTYSHSNTNLIPYIRLACSPPILLLWFYSMNLDCSCMALMNCMGLILCFCYMMNYSLRIWLILCFKHIRNPCS